MTQVKVTAKNSLKVRFLRLLVTPRSFMGQLEALTSFHTLPRLLDSHTAPALHFFSTFTFTNFHFSPFVCLY